MIPDILRLNETKRETNESNHETNETKRETDETDEIELNLNEMQLLAAIRLKPDITQKQLHDTTGISMSTIKRILPDLQKKGKLVRVGNHRSGTWKVI